jgi:hypothetical protein
MPRVRRRGLSGAAWACAVGALLAATWPRAAGAGAPEDVPALIELIRKRPAKLERAEWLEQRREAVRRLGRLGDRRAVPVLIEVLEAEKFDVIAEIAIEALGRLGDARAVPALRRVYHDASRDRYVRDAARTALRRLGADPNAPDDAATATAPVDEGDDPGSQPEPESAPADVAGDDADATEPAAAEPDAADPAGLFGDDEARRAPRGPAFGDDVLAATETLTFALGGIRLQYDTLRDSPSLDGDVAARYDRGMERPSVGWRYGGSVAIAAGVLDLPGDDTISRAVAASALVDGEARFYAGGGPWFGHLEGAVGASLLGVKLDRAGPDNDADELYRSVDLQAGLGVGHGRVVDVGEGLRLRRIEQVLAAARQLGRPIQPALAARILGAWWALRGEQGAYRRLLATVALLREGGVLLGEPDAGTTYKILQVLLDGQLDHRPAGFEARIGIAESYLERDPDSAAPIEGRQETAFARARYGRQGAGGGTELVATALARYRVLAGDGEPTPWTAELSGTWRRFFYGAAQDPIGALAFGGEIGASDDGIGDPDVDPASASSIGTRLAATIGWLWAPARASRMQLGATAALESEEVFVGVTFDVAYGLLDGSFVGGAAMPPAAR